MPPALPPSLILRQAVTVWDKWERNAGFRRTDRNLIDNAFFRGFRLRGFDDRLFNNNFSFDLWFGGYRAFRSIRSVSGVGIRGPDRGASWPSSRPSAGILAVG